MNLSLIDPFVLAQDLPDALETSIRCGHAVVIRFSNRGDFLALGRTDGKIVIYDWETYGIARKLKGHASQVNSLSWSQDDRYLLTSSLDYTAVLWDLQTGDSIRKVRFNAPCLIAELDPSNHCRFVIALLDQDAILVDTTEEEPTKISLSSVPKQSDAESKGKKSKKLTKPSTTVVAFMPTGDFFLTGTSHGWLNFHESTTGSMLGSVQISEAYLKVIKLTASGKHMVVLANEKIIRQYELPDLSTNLFESDTFHLEPDSKIVESINKGSPYNHVTTSNSGEYVILTESGTKSASVYARGANGLTLLSLLDPPEVIVFLEWHPHKPCVCAIGSTDGRIYVYSYLPPQRWSALAPDFMEVEENIDYTEKEDEFDIVPDEELHQRRLDLEEENVDVLTLDEKKPGQWQPGDFVMPLIMHGDGSDSDDDIIAIGAGQYRRKNAQMWADDESEAVPSGDEKKVTAANRKASKRKRNYD